MFSFFGKLKLIAYKHLVYSYNVGNRGQERVQKTDQLSKNSMTRDSSARGNMITNRSTCIILEHTYNPHSVILPLERLKTDEISSAQDKQKSNELDQ